MSNAIFFNYYKLKKGASVPDFLDSVENLINDYASKQKGFISFMLLFDGDTWADFGIFETMEDAKNFENPGSTNDLAKKFYSFLNFNTCRSRIYSVERNYQFKSGLPNVVTFVTYKLKKGMPVSDFLFATDKAGSKLSFNDSLAISWKLLVDGDIWADMIYWESMDGPQKASASENLNSDIKEYLSFIDDVPFHGHFSVELSL